MSQQYLSPYINFQGRAREAMEFYHTVLGGTLDLQTADQQGAARPAGPADRITHARLDVDGGLTIVATDGHPDYPATVGENMAVALGGSDREWLAGVFNGLAEGGRTKMPLGDIGYLTDRFAINWVVTVDPA